MGVPAKEHAGRRLWRSAEVRATLTKNCLPSTRLWRVAVHVLRVSRVVASPPSPLRGRGPLRRGSCHFRLTWQTGAKRVAHPEERRRARERLDGPLQRLPAHLEHCVATGGTSQSAPLRIEQGSGCRGTMNCASCQPQGCQSTSCHPRDRQQRSNLSIQVKKTSFRQGPLHRLVMHPRVAPTGGAADGFASWQTNSGFASGAGSTTTAAGSITGPSLKCAERAGKRSVEPRARAARPRGQRRELGQLLADTAAARRAEGKEGDPPIRLLVHNAASCRFECTPAGVPAGGASRWPQSCASEGGPVRFGSGVWKVCVRVSYDSLGEGVGRLAR